MDICSVADCSKTSVWRGLCKNHYYQNYLRTPEKKLKHRNLMISYRLNMRLECIYYYSNGNMKCECCGEGIIRFLTIDHTLNGGTKHRRSIGTTGGGVFYKWLIDNKFPEEYDVLCFNCNCGRAYNNGICPHKK